MAIQNSNVITLFSSESTEKYIKDIFAVLALPRNADYRFRYEKKYVENKVCNLFDDSINSAGTKALIAFRSKNIEEENKRFIVPIRWVEITKVEYRSDFYTVMFKVLGYPTFTQAFSQKCYEFCNINATAKSILDSKTNNFAVINNVLSEMVNGYQNDENTD